ncbi:MAG: acyltransferase [Geodermatophilaceae bacterium]|nr:acyltransferase [Geodermatophilaceae bacterium]
MRPAQLSPPGRDGSIDALRVAAVIGVVSGHWLVTAVVVGDYGLAVTSPLRHLPDLAPLTWVLQALAPFFCAAGFAATRALEGGQRWRQWASARVGALLPAVGTLLACWTVLLGVLLLSGFAFAEVRSLGKLVVGPLWFLAVLAVLWASWPALDWLDRRLRGWAVLAPAAVVGFDDLVWLGDLPVGPAAQSVIGVIGTVCAWAVPFLFGIRLARGGGPSRTGGLLMALAGMAAMATLILVLGYPASAVGVTGGVRSNLTPPSLYVLALGAVQLGLFVILRPAAGAVATPSPRLARWNTLALPVFLWHQSALILVLVASAEWMPLVGLTGRPDTFSWVLLRLAWFPVLVLVLACLVRLIAQRRLRPLRCCGTGRATRPDVGRHCLGIRLEGRGRQERRRVRRR